MLYRSEVKQLLFQNKKAAGVQLADGTQLFADSVVYSGTVWNLYEKLIDPALLKNGQREWARTLVPTYPSVVLYALVQAQVIPPDTQPVELLVGNPERLDESEVTVYISSLDDETLCPPGTHAAKAAGANTHHSRGKGGTHRMKKGTRKFLFGIVSLLALLAVAFYFYTADYYRADETALAVYTTQAGSIRTQGNYTVFAPPPGAAGTAGLIFYPGGKVDEQAYAPLLSALAQNGVTCVLVKMPFHLAVLDINAANGATALAPGVQSWYIGGHSLGGAMEKGEVAVALLWDYNALNYRDQFKAANPNANFEVSIPSEASIQSGYTTIINRYSKRPYAAALAREYILSDEGQINLARGYAKPVRDVELPADVKAKMLDVAQYKNARLVSDQAAWACPTNTLAGHRSHFAAKRLAVPVSPPLLPARSTPHYAPAG